MTLHFDGLRRCVPERRKFKKSTIRINEKLASIFVFAMVAIPIMPMKTEALVNETDSASPTISLFDSAHTPIVSKYVISTIVPGESLVQKEEREKAEALAKARAEQAAKSKKIVVVKKIYNDPSDFDVIYARAGEAFGIDAKLLKAIHIVETGASGSTYRANPSGATGPMQFLPSTFRRHGVDGNNDGVKDIGNVEDAIFSAAQYLKACGYPNVKKALWGYNPSERYFTKVMSIVASL